MQPARLLLLTLACLALTACHQQPAPRVFDSANSPEPARDHAVQTRPEAEPDRGEIALLASLHAAAASGNVAAALDLVTDHVVVESEAIHDGFEAWLATLATYDLTTGIIYTRQGAGGRFLTADARGPGGVLQLGFFVVDGPAGMRIGNVLSAQPVIPGVTPSLASSRANVLRAFWAYFAALRGVAPEYLPERAFEAPETSRRMRLAVWRSAVAPSLRNALVASGPDATRNSVPAYLDAMADLLADYHLPEVREADLPGGRAVVMFTPTEIAREARGREPFMIEYQSAWRNGMQMLVAERVYTGQRP